MSWCIVLWEVHLIFHCFLLCSSAVRVMVEGESIKDGDEPLISENGVFNFGFFSPDKKFPNFRYAGIWYSEKPMPASVIWVANREKPICDKNGVITMTNGGNLEVLDGNGVPVWSTNINVSASMTYIAELNEYGNLRVLKNRHLDGISLTPYNKCVWESFDYPTDTFLPGMRVYVDSEGGDRNFSSWKSLTDPSIGNYLMGIDSRRSPQIVIWEGGKRVWRSGYWTGLVFTGIPSMRANYLHGFMFSDDDGRRFFSYTKKNSSDELIFRVSYNGQVKHEIYNEGLMEWKVLQRHPSNACIHNRCGAFGICDPMTQPICSCLDRFQPKNVDAWSRGDWSGGCRRMAQLQCGINSNTSRVIQQQGGEPDGFLEIKGLKLPDYLDYVGFEDIRECKKKCLENCSCLAYSFVSGINCMIWTSDLVDLQHFAKGGHSLFVRVSQSEPSNVGKVGNKKKSKLPIIVAVVVGIAMFFLCLSIWLILRRRAKAQAIQNGRPMNKILPKSDQNSSWDNSPGCSPETSPDLPLYQFNVIVEATGNFFWRNKLGHGGFGDVYKGVLPGQQNIAVKRLSKRSTQGVEEFKNEITLIAKLQHRNLVKLLGCCIHGEEKMLIYEYMPNKSLDSFLTDPAKKSQLGWPTRFNIIEGIARGLLYLHRDSRLKIIHRDLKASNILLDEEMNPKISDFGMARIFLGNQNEANTKRVVGTYGYMAPEYAMEGLFSVKSDVYSFGILLLEVISGHMNTRYRSSEYTNLKSFAWDLWDKANPEELIDPSITSLCNIDQVLRCIHIGMLCVQDSAIHRPDMPTVVFMLESQNAAAALPLPRQPTLSSMRRSEKERPGMWHVNRDIESLNDVTVTAPIGR